MSQSRQCKALLNLGKDSAIFVCGKETTQPRSIDLTTQLTTLDDGWTFTVQSLLDSGCTGSCIDMKFIQSHGINTKKFDFPMYAYNADGTKLSGGPITDYVELWVGLNQHVEILTLAVSDCRWNTVFLGYDWLYRHNPVINWKMGTISLFHCPDYCYEQKSEEHPHLSDKLFMVDPVMLRSLQLQKTSHSTNIAAKVAVKMTTKTFLDLIPEHY